ncbi:hypothetical protein BCR42DRAFT_408561 [Absidia repens]|uniref:Uncharacterized protein n=1 Tax=Absidia repens TaxID=90262 RepID=A0A1X2IQ12_9FUNG|nr:hypothetical protein BCR42DRAFT_408561 [Absidia repens]
MKHKKDIETKLRHYISTNQSVPNSSSPKTPTTISVSEKLAKLRIEQARSVANRERKDRGGPSSGEQQQQTIGHVYPWPALNFSIDEQQSYPQPPLPIQQLPRPAAGPPPPPSWSTRRPVLRPETPLTNLSCQNYRKQDKKLERTASTIPSLVRTCCRQLAHHFTIATAVNDSSRWIDQIKKMPSHVKQRILFEWCFFDGDDYDDGDNYNSQRLVTGATMGMFEKTEYEELWLEASNVSLERLIRAFWKLDKVASSCASMVVEPVDDWEDLLWDHDHTTTTLENNTTDDYDPPPAVVLDLDSQEEIGKWKYLSHIATIFLRKEPSTIAACPTYSLSSPFLGRTLVSLNISFMRPASSSPTHLCWIAFAHLVVSTLPHLNWLYSACCFDKCQGLEILKILSQGLRKLKFWDMGYHSWLKLDALTTAINWQSDLMELNTLCLSSGPTRMSSDITKWFKNHHLARIKLIWRDM